MNAPGANKPSFIRSYGPALLIVAAAFAVYFRAFGGDWLWDDSLLIRNNPFVLDPAGLWKTWFEPRLLVDYFPLTASVEWIQWRLWGEDTAGYHAVNVLLHAAGALLVWRLLARLGVRRGWIGGLLFAVHPVAVESVAWMAELKNTLSVPLLLLAMLAWIDYDNSGRRPLYRRALALFLAAMLAKTSSVMFPFVLLLYAWWRHGRIARADVVASLPFFAVSLVLGVVTLRYQHPAMDFDPVLPHSFVARVALAGTIMAFYISKSFLPLGLLPAYRLWTVDPGSLAPWLTWLALFVTAAACWIRRRTWGRHVALGLGFFLLNLLPFVGFNPAAYMGFTWVMDHILYLPIIGVIGLVAAACDQVEKLLSGPARPWATGVAGAVLALLACESYNYTGVFASQGTLWSAVLRDNPESGIAEGNLGFYYVEAGDTAAAITHYLAAIKLVPGYTYAHNGLGNALDMQGRIPEAIPEYREAIRELPGYAEAHNGLANALLGLGQLDEARVEGDLALKLRPTYADALCTLGLIDAQQGRIPDAIAKFERAQRLAPRNGKIQQELDYLRSQR